MILLSEKTMNFRRKLIMGKSDYSKGIEAAAKANVDFMKKQSEGIKNITGKLSQHVDEVGRCVKVALEDLNLQEKKKLYNLNDSLNIAKLGDNEKEVLVSVLYTLISKYKQNNENQLEYFRNVKNYLGIEEPDPNFDLSRICNVDSKNETKAMYKTVCSFLFLNREDTSFLEKFEEELSYFDINDKISSEIINSILDSYKALKLKGIVDYYNFDYASVYDNETISPNSLYEEKEALYNHVNISPYTHIAIKIADKISTEKLTWFETKDYFVYCEKHKWMRYTKSNEKTESFDSFNTAYEAILESKLECEIYKNGAFEEFFESFTQFDRIKFVHNHRGMFNSSLNIDYYQNTIYLLLEDKIHRIDIENDTYNKWFDLLNDEEDGPVYTFWVDNNVLLVIGNNSIVTEMTYDNFCSKKITDKNGRPVRFPMDHLPALCNNYIYFIPSEGGRYVAEDDNGLRNNICRFSVKSKLERVCELTKTDYHLYSSCGKVYLISTESDNLEINMITSENVIAPCGRYEGDLLEIKLYPKYISALFETKDSIMLYIFDCEEDQADDVCLAEKRKKKGGVRQCKASVNYQIIGNMLYYDVLINNKLQNKYRFKLEKTLFDHFNPFIM